MLLRPSQSLSLLLLASVFVSCSGKRTSGYNPANNAEIGPFDEDGNYIEAWADNPPKTQHWGSTASSKPKPAPRPEPKPAPVVVSQPEPTIVSTPKPTPRPVAKPKPVVKPKPKPAPVKVLPKFKVYSVVKGDTLYGIGRKYGVTVRAIQQANGISGSNLQIGKVLKIPAK